MYLLATVRPAKISAPVGAIVGGPCRSSSHLVSLPSQAGSMRTCISDRLDSEKLDSIYSAAYRLLCQAHAPVYFRKIELMPLIRAVMPSSIIYHGTSYDERNRSVDHNTSGARAAAEAKLYSRSRFRHRYSGHIYIERIRLLDSSVCGYTECRMA